MMFDPEALPVPDLGLSCKRCGYPLAGASAHRCPECGERFTLDEYVPRGDWPALIAGGEEVRGTRRVIEILWAYQIPFMQLTDPLRSALSAAWPGAPRRPERIAVPRDRFFEAVDLMRRDQLGEPMPEPPARVQRSEDWDCAHCGETNPANFEVCWNCGRVVADAPE